MALTAGEYISGGEVRDADGRTVVTVEGGAGGGASIAQGTAAARPGTPVTNFYFATDSGELSIANAGLTAWQPIAQTSAAAFTVNSNGSQKLTGGFGGSFVNLANTSDVHISSQGSDVFIDSATAGKGSLDITRTGAGLKVAEGANAKQGTSVLVAGAVVVSNTSVTATSRIFLTSNADGGTPGFLRVSARTAGTSFTITSSSGTDTSTVAWEIFEVG